MLQANKRVFASVSIELGNLFSVLSDHYSRHGHIEGLQELTRLESYLKAKLVEYDPQSAQQLDEELFLNTVPLTP